MKQSTNMEINHFKKHIIIRILYVFVTIVFILVPLMSSCSHYAGMATKSSNGLKKSSANNSVPSKGISSVDTTPSNCSSSHLSSSKTNSSSAPNSNNPTYSSSLSVNVTSSSTSITTPSLPPLIGTNMTGGEMVYYQANTSNPVSGQDYLFVSHQDIDYILSKGMNFIRLVFSWEGMQNNLNGSLSTNGYANDMYDRVNYATSKGLYVLIEPHGAVDADFGAYKGNKVGSPAVSNDDFADFWGKMATLYKSNSRVLIGLSNEPHDTPATQWFGAAQAAITAIRKAGFSNAIFVPGIGYTGAENWTSANSTEFMKLIDPQKNLVVSVHMYTDQNSGGFDTTIVSPTVFVDRVTRVTNWAKQNNIRIHISEFAVSASNSLAQTTIDNLTNYIYNNSENLIGGSFWAYGPPSWWSGYQFTLDPTNNYSTDSPQMRLLSAFIAINKKMNDT